MIVYLLNEDQKNLLIEQFCSIKNEIKFNPIKDSLNRWIISQEEIKTCDNEEFYWIKDLEPIEFSSITYNSAEDPE